MIIVAPLWADEGENYAFDFVGEFFHLEGVQSYPKPVQSPGPMVMSADAIPAGLKFAFDHANILFAAFPNVERSAEAVSKLRRNADGAGRRDLALWSGVHIICKDTEKKQTTTSSTSRRRATGRAPFDTSTISGTEVAAASTGMITSSPTTTSRTNPSRPSSAPASFPWWARPR